MQMTFGAVADPQANAAWTGLHEALVHAIQLITPKELCWRLKIKGQYLSDAIKGVDRKGIRAEWIPVILEMAPESARAAILKSLASPFGYEIERRRELTLEERFERLEKRVASRFGQAGRELLEELER